MQPQVGLTVLQKLISLFNLGQLFQNLQRHRFNLRRAGIEKPCHRVVFIAAALGLAAGEDLADIQVQYRADLSQGVQRGLYPAVFNFGQVYGRDVGRLRRLLLGQPRRDSPLFYSSADHRIVYCHTITGISISTCPLSINKLIV